MSEFDIKKEELIIDVQYGEDGAPWDNGSLFDEEAEDIIDKIMKENELLACTLFVAYGWGWDKEATAQLKDGTFTDWLWDLAEITTDKIEFIEDRFSGTGAEDILLVLKRTRRVLLIEYGATLHWYRAWFDRLDNKDQWKETEAEEQKTE